MTVYNFILAHVAGFLPDLSFYPRPATFAAVLVTIVIGVFAIRLVAKLLPVLALAAIAVLVFHHAH
jgi:hypothetical protein